MSTEPPTLSGPPERAKRHENPPFDDQGHATLPDISQTDASIAELEGKYDRLTRELILVSIMFIVLVALAWAALTGMFTESEKVEQPATNWFRVAQAHIQEDQLTQPPGANALEAYLKAQQLALNPSAIDKGLQVISARYLEIIRKLIETGDIKLAEETLESAALVIPHAPKDYAEALAEARNQLEQLRQRRVEQRESARSSAETYQPLAVFQDYLKDGSPGPRMVVIPEGNFVLGSPEDEAERDSDEKQLPVSIRRFAMAQTEVTFDEYRLFTEAVGWALPDDFNWGSGQRPVMNVSWLEARTYANWLSEQTGFRYRLPTEAEWEYAARAGTTTRFTTGDCLTPDYANIDFRSKSRLCVGIPVNFGQTVPVGDHLPNPWGLHNMYGNVREWVLDCAAHNYNPLIADGSAYYYSEGGSCGANGKRSVRGGAWHAPVISSRIANRYAIPEHEWANSVGIRLVRELD